MDKIEFNLERSIQLLRNTPNILNAYMGNIPEEFIRINEGPDTWSPFDVIGHLIHGEQTDWIPRVKIILSEGQDKNFEPFDRFAQFETSKGKSMSDLLRDFENLRIQNIDSLLGFNLSEPDLQKEGIHPEFGVVTLKELLTTWVVHDQSHLIQIARVVAKCHSNDVGPWKKYLSVMN